MPWETERLVGVAVFSVPINQATIPAYSGESPEHGIELGRLVLEDTVESNGETAFLTRALRLLRAALPDLRVLLSFSNPVPRIIRQVEIKPGHLGIFSKSSILSIPESQTLVKA